MTKVKILAMTQQRDLEVRIEEYLLHGFKLAGPVTTAVRMSGDFVYVATLILEEVKTAPEEE